MLRQTKDAAAAELKSETIQSLAGLIELNLGRNPPQELPVATTYDRIPWSGRQKAATPDGDDDHVMGPG
jgi:hypothetical protein